MTKTTGEGTASLEKAIDVLDAISESVNGLSQNELAERVPLPRTTLYRILATLIARGLVRRDPTRRVHCLGYRCVEMAKQVYSMPDLVSAASHELRTLRDLTGETSYIGALEGADVVSLERYDSPHSLRSNASLGHRKPVYATSQGKAILSALPTDERDAILRGLRPKALTPSTITDRRRLQAELRIVSRRGYAIDDEENVPGTRCVGAPVIDPHGIVRGAISVAGPAYRLTHKRLELLGPEIVAAAKHIGAQLAPVRSNADADSPALPTTAAPALYGAHPQWCNVRKQLYWVDTMAPALRISEGSGGERKINVDRPITAMLTGPADVQVFHKGGVAVVNEDGVRPAYEWKRSLVTACQADNTTWAAFVDEGKCRIGTLDSNRRFSVKWMLGEPVDYLKMHPVSRVLYATAPESGDILMLIPGSAAVRKFARVPKSSGILSGIDFDDDGGLWVALKEGWSVIRFSADGDVDKVVPLPVPFPTGVAVGGIDRTSLYVTTARQPVSLDLLRKAPLSGRLFKVAL